MKKGEINMLQVDKKVKIKDIEKVRNDPFLEENALLVIEEENFIGEITKIEDGIHFVGFINDNGWVTQGFKADEIEEVE